MGSLLSKDSNKQEDISVEKSTPTKPILTPNTRISDIDPRSPSANICRTPIEILATPIKHDLGVHDTFTLNSPGIINKVLLDPRSPAVEFIRTPIVAQEKKAIILRNKNLDNVLLNDTPKQRKPRLLDSTPINETVKSLSKRKSFAGYLETNLDFVETHLDEVILRKSLSNLCTKSDYTPVQSMVNRIDKVHDEDGNEDFNSTLGDEGLISNVNANNKENIAQIQNIMDDIIDDVFKIEDVKMDIIPRIVAISPRPRKIIKNFDKKIKDLIYEERLLEAKFDNNSENKDIESMKDSTSLESLPISNENNSSDKDANKLEDNLPSEDFEDSKVPNNKMAAREINITAENHNKEFSKEVDHNSSAKVIKDKKREKIIPKDGEIFDNIIKRVPLTDRNCANKSRSIPKLRVHDKPRKPQYSVSKIPQFKGKRFNKVPQTQCENTPPPKNGSVWDNEETLII